MIQDVPYLAKFAIAFLVGAMPSVASARPSNAASLILLFHAAKVARRVRPRWGIARSPVPTRRGAILTTLRAVRFSPPIRPSMSAIPPTAPYHLR